MSPKLEGIDKERIAQRDATTSSYARFGEIGNTGIQKYGGTIYEEFLTALEMPACLKVYKEMSMNDPTIGAILYVAEQLIRRIKWPIVAGGTKPIDIELKNFIEECKYDMSTTWIETITEILSYFVYGWSWHEIVYKIRRGSSRNSNYSSKYSDGKIGWRKLPGRSQDSWQDWKFKEDSDELIAFEQMTTIDSSVHVIPIEKSLLFRTRADRGNPEGKSLLRNAYRPWFFKKHVEEIEAIGIERALAGLPVLQPPEGTNLWNPNNPDSVSLKTHAEKVVSNVRRDKNEGLVLPFGWTFSLVASSGRSQFDTNAIVNRYDQRIAIVLLADLVLLGAEKVGSFALSEVKKSLLAYALEAQTQAIATVFNKFAIPRLIDLNGFKGFTDYPKMVPEDIELPDLRNFAEFIDILSQIAPAVFKDPAVVAYLRQVGGMPESKEPESASIIPKETNNKVNENNKVNDDEEEEEEENNKGDDENALQQ